MIKVKQLNCLVCFNCLIVLMFAYKTQHSLESNLKHRYLDNYL